MAKLDFKEIISPALKLFIICLVSAFLLAGTNYFTEKKIDENLKNQEIESRKVVFNTAFEFKDEGAVTVNEKQVNYCIALDENGEKIGYVFTCQNKGYGGEVSVMTGIGVDGSVVRSVVLSMDDETPGLGQNAGKEEFLNQFINKTGPFLWVKADGKGDEITGVTSATFTSKAVINCVNDSLDAYKLLGGEN